MLGGILISMKESKTTRRQFRFKKRDVLFLIVGLVLAFAIRFALVDAHTVHHHANFALYVNGTRDTFDNFTFYEEVSSCSGTNQSNPKGRTHMHKPSNDIVHVHDAGSTWGAFFANLGYTLGNNVLVTDKGTFKDGENNVKLRFILNGKEVQAIANEPINSKDRLLIDYSSGTTETLNERYDTVANNAGEYNSKPDPSSCSGGAEETLRDRFIRTLGIEQNADSRGAGVSH